MAFMFYSSGVEEWSSPCQVLSRHERRLVYGLLRGEARRAQYMLYIEMKSIEITLSTL